MACRSIVAKKPLGLDLTLIEMRWNGSMDMTSNTQNYKYSLLPSSYPNLEPVQTTTTTKHKAPSVTNLQNQVNLRHKYLIHIGNS